MQVTNWTLHLPDSYRPLMLIPLLDKALASRAPQLDAAHESAFRLFNGFSEGHPALALDIYGRTLVIHNHANEPNQIDIQAITEHLRHSLNWLHAGIIKTRNGKTQTEKNGILLFGDKPDNRIKEHGVWYAIDLALNRDASFYLDTRNLRKWLIENMNGKSVLNTFAYTGSLGVAATAGGATRVVQTDRNRQFLNLAKDSYSLNGFPTDRKDFIAHDFFPAIARFKSTNQLFDCVILDPPFFSTTDKGRVDQEHDSARLINKVRPLIIDGGILVAINNALYVSGQDYLRTLEDLCRDGYLDIAELIPVPEDCVGYNTLTPPITDPSPFNHSTKIAVLKVRRKTSRRFPGIPLTVPNGKSQNPSHGFHEFTRIIQKESVKICEIRGEKFPDCRSFRQKRESLNNQNRSIHEQRAPQNRTGSPRLRM